MRTKKPVLKHHQATSLCFAAAFAVASQASGAVINSQFEAATELNDYTQRTNLGALVPAGTGFVFGSSAGRGTPASGGLTRGTTGDVTAINTAAVFNLTQKPTVTLSEFFFVSDATPNAFASVLQLGLSANNNTGFYGDAGHAFVSGRLNRGTAGSASLDFQSQTKTSSGSPVAATHGSVTVANNTWYKFTLSLTPTATANQFSHSMILENWGADGSAFVSTAASSTPGTFSNSELYTDTTTYAGFRNINGQGVTKLDSFVVSLAVVPEPSGFLLLGCSAIGLLVRRKR